MEENREPIRVGVREMCDFLCRSGSLDSWAGASRMVEGTRLHNIIQSRAEPGYVREVPLSREFVVDGTSFILSGRADGIIGEVDSYTIDEIKTTTIPLRFINPTDFPAHQAQVECYACIFALDNNLDFVRTRITYANLETEDTRYCYEEYTAAELLRRVNALLLEYKKWILIRESFTSELRESTKSLIFPYNSLRPGQDGMIRSVYRAIKNRERIFIEAPTGIGKTISAIYPAFLALGRGLSKRIFYLTSKTTLRNSAANAINLLRKNGLRNRTIILSAKEKICLCKEAVRDCDSLICQYSDEHFSRVNSALLNLLNNFEVYDEAIITNCAEEYKVCPYELSLDLALWCDIIICDYNYLFDHRVALKRFFSDDCKPDENIFLIDEAHNLVNRSRDMYSSELSFQKFLRILRHLKPEDPLYTPLRGLCKAFLSLKKRADSNFETPGFDVSKSPYEAFAASVEYFLAASVDWLKANREAPFANDVAELRSEALDYSYKLALFDESFVNYTESIDDRLRVKLLCIDPSKLLSERLKKGRAAVFFSATLTPIEYFSKVLGGGEHPVELQLKSPFPTENLFVGIMEKVSTRYLDRSETLNEIAGILRATVDAKTGNYIAFFPSYKLMRETAKCFAAIAPEVRILIQQPDMYESDRKAFLKHFENSDSNQSLLGFAVMGGIFGEGIDLVGERLIGTIIVGVGLARLNSESNIIASYYEETSESGFDYAYLFPGMNKVLQAAGRVIRTETDRGVVILVDDRFATPRYTRLFPAHWRKMRAIGDIRSLSAALKSFWNV